MPLLLAGCSMLLMWTWVRGTALLSQKTHRDSISTRDLIRMLQKSKPTRVPGTAIFLTSDPEVAPSALMHNLKHNKVLHERIIIMSVQAPTTRRACRRPTASRSRRSPTTSPRSCCTTATWKCPRMPAALATLRKAGLKFDIMTTSFFLGRRTLKASPTPACRVAGQALHRPVEAGRDRDRLLLDPVRSRRGTRRAGLGLSLPAARRADAQARSAIAA